MSDSQQRAAGGDASDASGRGSRSRPHRIRDAASLTMHRLRSICNMVEFPWYRLVQLTAAMDRDLSHGIANVPPYFDTSISKRSFEAMKQNWKHSALDAVDNAVRNWLRCPGTRVDGSGNQSSTLVQPHPHSSSSSSSCVGPPVSPTLSGHDSRRGEVSDVTSEEVVTDVASPCVIVPGDGDGTLGAWSTRSRKTPM